MGEGTQCHTTKNNTYGENLGVKIDWGEKSKAQWGFQEASLEHKLR